MGRALKLTSPKAALIRLGIESLRSGTIASLVMMPFGFLFLSLGLRVGHYGPKLGEAIFGLRPMPWMQALLLGQHFVIAWLSALPLLLFWMWRSPRPIYLADGLVFGVFDLCDPDNQLEQAVKKKGGDFRRSHGQKIAIAEIHCHCSRRDQTDRRRWSDRYVGHAR